MERGSEEGFARIAREVMGDAHTPAVIAEMADHGTKLAALRSSLARDMVPIGLRIAKCGQMIRDAVLAISGDSPGSRKEASDKLFNFVEQTLQIRPTATRLYMHPAQYCHDNGLDPSKLTVGQLLSHT